MTEPRYHCTHCALSFRVGERPRKAAITRCMTCGLIFWHGQPAGVGHAVVGITPAELAQQGAEVTT